MPHPPLDPRTQSVNRNSCRSLPLARTPNTHPMRPWTFRQHEWRFAAPANNPIILHQPRQQQQQTHTRAESPATTPSCLPHPAPRTPHSSFHGRRPPCMDWCPKDGGLQVARNFTRASWG
ncbi:hypothetical protein MFRU_012g00970 [Monilinia fructicola]|nr:hypothetical protein MFRU_012g00970 [Monilinia fructicola]